MILSRIGKNLVKNLAWCDLDKISCQYHAISCKINARRSDRDDAMSAHHIVHIMILVVIKLPPLLM